MKIDYCSDLHVDSWISETTLVDHEAKRWMGEPFKSTFVYLDWERYKNEGSRVLVIAGDVANNLITTSHVLEVAADAYEYVIIVDGNHDHYSNNMDVESGMTFLKTLMTQYPNVYHLDGETSLIIDNVAFYGATGWYDWRCYEEEGISENLAFRTWTQYSNDYRLPTFERGTPNHIAMIQAVNLSEQVRAANMDDSIEHIVMVTHMSPRGDLMEWKNHNPTWNALTPSYVNTALKQVAESDEKGKISHWIYGHTHDRKMVEKDGIVYCNNARGYPRENPPFSLTQIEVGAN